MKFLFTICFCFVFHCFFGQAVDTNFVDKDNLKQGYWQILGQDRKLPNYKDNQLLEEGIYVNSRKQGLWIKYYPNGSIKSKIAYVNSRPRGFYETYYVDGRIKEKGVWKSSRNGNFESFDYDEDKCLSIWKHYRKDKITEVKKYVSCNCLWYEIVLDTATGLAVRKEYENGMLVEAKPFTLEMERVIQDSIALMNGYERFKSYITVSEYLHGQQKMYNSTHQIVMDGYFKKNKLKDGKRYVYNDKGELIRIQLYKRGRYIGDESIPVEEK